MLPPKSVRNQFRDVPSYANADSKVDSANHRGNKSNKECRFDVLRIAKRSTFGSILHKLWILKIAYRLGYSARKNQNTHKFIKFTHTNKQTHTQTHNK